MPTSWMRSTTGGAPLVSRCRPAAATIRAAKPLAKIRPRAGGGRRRSSLAAHLERLIARLTALRASSQSAAVFPDALEQATRELDLLLPEARRARGAARDAVLDRLQSLDRALMDAVLLLLDAETRAAAESEAQQALGPFRERMDPEAFRRATAAAFERQVRDRYGLPVISFD